MRDFHCPTCGRWLAESDAPPGYKIRVPPCPRCAANVVLRTERDYPRKALAATGRR